MKEEKSTIQSMKELRIMMELGDYIIEKMQKDFSKLKIGESYNGKFKPFIIEYINTFLVRDIKDSIKNNDLDSIKEDIMQEAMFIECFCKWLDEEKNIVPSSTQAHKK